MTELGRCDMAIRYNAPHDPKCPKCVRATVESCDRCGVEFADDGTGDHVATTCDSCIDAENIAVQLAHEHTSGMHDTAAVSACRMCQQPRASGWALVDADGNLMTCVYGTSAEALAEYDYGHDEPMTGGSVEFVRALPDAADLPRIML